MVSGGIVRTAVIISLDPHHHRVRTIGPADTSVGTGRCIFDRCHTRHICPRGTQRYISGRSSSDTQQTDELILDLERFTRTTGRLMRKVKLVAHLIHIREMPVLRLSHVLKLCSRPILKMRVRKLLCHYRRKTD